MQKTKLLSYTLIDFPSKAQMNLYIKYIEQIENDKSNSEKLLNAGLVRRTHSQIWNSNNVFRIGVTFEYEDEKCFNKVQKLLSEFMNNAETKELLINTKMSASRGVVLIDKFFKIHNFTLHKFIILKLNTYIHFF